MTNFLPILIATVCACGEAPERANDFYWENDKVGFRAYGPGDPHVWSGFDIFNKLPDAGATCGEVLHNHDKCGDWHVTPYKGILDNYTIGAGRGCGGIAMFADGEWKTFPNWESYRVITNGDERCEFELVYPAFSAAGKMTCHITLEKGSRFFRNDVSFEKKVRDFWIGPGLDLEPKRDHHGAICEVCTPGCAYVSLFEDVKNEMEGATATAIVMFDEPNARLMTDNQNCRVIAVNAQRFTYYAGAAWSKAGEITSTRDWSAAVYRLSVSLLDNPERKTCNKENKQ